YQATPDNTGQTLAGHKVPHEQDATIHWGRSFHSHAQWRGPIAANLLVRLRRRTLAVAPRPIQTILFGSARGQGPVPGAVQHTAALELAENHLGHSLAHGSPFVVAFTA